MQSQNINNYRLNCSIQNLQTSLGENSDLVSGIDDDIDVEVPWEPSPEVDLRVDLVVDGESGRTAGTRAGGRLVAGEWDDKLRRWSGSVQRGTWSSVTAGSIPPTAGAMAATAAVEEAEDDAAVGNRCCMAAAGS
jgi:hypothetical protein